MTIEQAWDKLEALVIKWEDDTNQNSLIAVSGFMGEFESFLDDLIYYSDFGDIPADLNNAIDILDNDIFEQWAYLKFKAGECNMLGYPIGGRV